MVQSKSTKNSGVSQVVITACEHGQRIDNFLITYLKGVPKSRIYRILRTGEVRVNKGRIKPPYRLQAGDILRIPPIRVSEKKQPVNTNLASIQTLANSILFENEDFMVIDKPAGIAVHAGSGVDYGVIEAMRAVRTDLAFLELAHRLDRETSGCLLLAKNRIALNACHELFRQHTVTKIYQVVVLGRWPESLQMVDVALQKNSSQGGERKTTVSSQGKSAKTHFRVLEYYSSATLLEAKLETGRTHQIRVHTAHSGYPVIGDEKYGDKQFNQYARQNGIGRLLLHAYRLVFACPLTDKKIDIKSQRSLIKYEKSLNSL